MHDCENPLAFYPANLTPAQVPEYCMELDPALRRIYLQIRSVRNSKLPTHQI